MDANTVIVQYEVVRYYERFDIEKNTHDSLGFLLKLGGEVFLPSRHSLLVNDVPVERLFFFDEMTDFRLKAGSLLQPKDFFSIVTFCSVWTRD